MKNKGFTLVEILAVIVILGIIMMIAVPRVSEQILKSKKSTYVTDSKRFIEAARNVVETGQLKLVDKTTTYYNYYNHTPYNSNSIEKPFHRCTKHCLEC